MSLKDDAQEILEIIESGRYQTEADETIDFLSQQKAAEADTELFRPQDFPTDLVALESAVFKGKIEIVDATTSRAAYENSASELVLLNFASARNPGGGFLKGAKAQEEDLCRNSGLYPCLLTQPDYYASNRRCKSLLYTDHLIYSPSVPFFKMSGEKSLLDELYFPSVITCPAPNAAELRKDPHATPRLVEAFLRRWAMILWVAQQRGHSTILLGAWGCGAFGNEAEHSVQTVKKCLNSKHFASSFERVIFAIPDRGKRSAKNLAIFKSELL